MLRALAILPALALAALGAPPTPPTPESVAVLYNSSVKESERLATIYSEARGIPRDNLIGLALPDREEISRDDYDQLIRQPLIEAFDRRAWWERRPDAQGNLQLARTRIQVLACMRGIPSRIRAEAPPTNAEGKPRHPSQEQMMRTRNGSVDGELALLASDGLPAAGPLSNPYFKQDKPFAAAALPILLVGRIDAHSYEVCQRMIRDALAAEKNGLWGTALVDVANKVPQGDQWMEMCATRLAHVGIPTVVDRFKPTLPAGFPLRDVAWYFGWYSGNPSGELAADKFRFKTGAVAVHLHSFSASQLRHPQRNWCAPLLARGAAATVGNTGEPFLHLTHHLDLFVERLLAGYTLVEASHMALPALSWQAVTLGDPLYRPGLHLDGGGKTLAGDVPYRALRLAQRGWGGNVDELDRELRDAANRMEEPFYLEALGLDLARRRENARAAAAFRDARELFRSATDKARMDLHLAMLDHRGGNATAAVQTLRAAEVRYPGLPATRVAATWLEQLSPE